MFKPKMSLWDLPKTEEEAVRLFPWLGLGLGLGLGLLNLKKVVTDNP